MGCGEARLLGALRMRGCCRYWTSPLKANSVASKAARRAAVASIAVSTLCRVRVRVRVRVRARARVRVRIRVRIRVRVRVRVRG